LENPGFESRQGDDIFRHVVHAGSDIYPGVHPASYSVGIGVISRVLRGRGLKVTTHARLAPRLKMNAAVSLLPSVPSLCGKEQFVLIIQ
jgi:hypothetical protein